MNLEVSNVKKDNRLKKLRQEKGVSQERCAQDTGISLSSIKRYEKSGVVGNSYNLKLLAEYYCVEMDYIYNINEIKMNEENHNGIKGN